MSSWSFKNDLFQKNDFISFLGFLGLRLGFSFLRFIGLGLGLGSGLNKMDLAYVVCLKYYMKFYTIHRFDVYVCISYNILYGIKYMVTYQIFV
jgi:hypothetical protein